jgi:hypothetical protein
MSAPAETFGSARALEQHLDTTEQHLDIMGEESSKSSCAASVNNRPAFSPCFLTRNESDMMRLLSIWHLCKAPLERRSMSEAKPCDEKELLRECAVSAAEIREEA